MRFIAHNELFCTYCVQKLRSLYHHHPLPPPPGPTAECRVLYCSRTLLLFQMVHIPSDVFLVTLVGMVGINFLLCIIIEVRTRTSTSTRTVHYSMAFSTAGLRLASRLQACLSRGLCMYVSWIQAVGITIRHHQN